MTAFQIYSCLARLAIWGALVPAQLLSIALGRSSWDELRQRLGRNSAPPRVRGRRLMIHAVSAGEVVAAGGIVAELSSRVPDLEVVATVGNRDGARMAESLKPRGFKPSHVCFLPWDQPAVMRSWLGRWQPDLVVVVETEIWPGLFRSCRELDIPLCVASGRIYRSDVARYRLAKRFFKAVLESANWIGVQSKEEESRFLQIGAPAERVEVVGNAKFSVLATRPGRDSFRFDGVGGGRMVVAACTHGPEEKYLLRALRTLRPAFPLLRLILAPRRINRARSIEREVSRFGFAATRSSRLESAQGWDVLILDEFGALGGAYRAADVAVIGGSFVRRGGHNPLEAAAQGCAIIVGPHTEHVRDFVDPLRSAAALIQLQSEHQLADALGRLLADDTARGRMAAQARSFLDAGQNTADVYASILSRHFRPVGFGVEGRRAISGLRR